MRRSAALLAAGTLIAGLAAAGPAGAVDYLGPLAQKAAADGKCVLVTTLVDTGTNTSTTSSAEEGDCPDGVAPGSIVSSTYNYNPPSQLAPGSRGSLVQTSKSVQPQPPYTNPYTTTVVKPTPKTASTTSPTKH